MFQAGEALVRRAPRACPTPSGPPRGSREGTGRRAREHHLMIAGRAALARGLEVPSAHREDSLGAPLEDVVRPAPGAEVEPGQAEENMQLLDAVVPHVGYAGDGRVVDAVDVRRQRRPVVIGVSCGRSGGGREGATGWGGGTRGFYGESEGVVPRGRAPPPGKRTCACFRYLSIPADRTRPFDFVTPRLRTTRPRARGRNSAPTPPLCRGRRVRPRPPPASDTPPRRATQTKGQAVRRDSLGHDHRGAVHPRASLDDPPRQDVVGVRVGPKLGVDHPRRRALCRRGTEGGRGAGTVTFLVRVKLLSHFGRARWRKRGRHARLPRDGLRR